MNAHLTYDKNENGWDGVGRDDEQQDDQDDQAKTYCRTLSCKTTWQARSVAKMTST